jgi:hypothetical protein
MKIFREKGADSSPPSEVELKTHHGPFLKLMYDILNLVDQKDINPNTLEMFFGIRRIIHMSKGHGVLPDGSTESISERIAKGITNSAYSKGNS